MKLERPPSNFEVVRWIDWLAMAATCNGLCHSPATVVSQGHKSCMPALPGGNDGDFSKPMKGTDLNLS